MDTIFFQVWNIADLSLVYQSTIITASPFISMSMNLHVPQVAIGTADGIVRVYDLSDGKDFRCVHQINIGKIMDKYRQSKEQSLLSPTSQKNGISYVKYCTLSIERLTNFYFYIQLSKATSIHVPINLIQFLDSLVN